MAFRNLEQRFNETVDDLYRGAKLKFDGGKASTGINDDPLMVRTPGDGRLGIKQEGRSVPFNSGPRDTVRLTLFSASVRGIAFYAKQQLLQTGNTFAITRGLNPTFVIGNTIPFLHVRRHLRPLEGLLGRTPPQTTDQLKRIGRLQKETYDKLARRPSIIVSDRPIKEVILNKLSSFATANRSIGDGDYPVEFSRPEIAEGNYHVYNMITGVGNEGTQSNLLASFANKILPQAISRRLNNLFLSPEKVSNSIDLSAVKNRYGVSSPTNDYTTYYTSGIRLNNNGIDYQKFDVSAYSRETNSTDETIRSNLILNQSIKENYTDTEFLDAESLQAKITENTIDDSYIEDNKIIDGGTSGPAQDYRLASLAPNNDPNRLFKTTGVPDNTRSDLITKEPLKDRNREVLDRRINTLREDFQRSSDEFITDITGGAISTQPFLKYFIPDNTGVIVSRDGGTNARDLSNDNGRKLKYLKDALNYETDETIKALSRYNKLPSAGQGGDESITDGSGNKIDPVLISFAMGNDAHVQFRAFIRDINQTVNPEYKTYQYVGRIEKFITYVSVQREVSFKLDVLSFSKDELKVVWNRINYLTSFAFPYEVNKGILQPNIVRFTIGKMYRDQPGYVTSLSTVFNEISESWDIDEEVPIAATINISMAIIEKTTMTANKPFYAISEENVPVAEIGVETTPNQ
jgi:hypothetical protein